MAADADANARANAGRKRRKPRSLLLLLKSLTGLRVRVDLKNDVVLEGVVQEVVRDMECVAAAPRRQDTPRTRLMRVRMDAFGSLTMLDACETKPDVRLARTVHGAERSG